MSGRSSCVSEQRDEDSRGQPESCISPRALLPGSGEAYTLVRGGGSCVRVSWEVQVPAQAEPGRGVGLLLSPPALGAPAPHSRLCFYCLD